MGDFLWMRIRVKATKCPYSNVRDKLKSLLEKPGPDWAITFADSPWFACHCTDDEDDRDPERTFPYRRADKPEHYIVNWECLCGIGYNVEVIYSATPFKDVVSLNEQPSAVYTVSNGELKRTRAIIVPFIKWPSWGTGSLEPKPKRD